MIRRNNKKHLIIAITMACILLALLGVFVSKDDSTNVEVKKNVHVLSQEICEEYEVLKISEKQILFAKNPKYEKHDILVSGMTEQAPNGFVRKIIEIESKDGKTILHTENALLTDVFEEAHITKVFLLSDSEASEVINDSFDRELNFDELQARMSPDEAICRLIGTEVVYAESESTYLFQKDINRILSPSSRIEGFVGFNAWLQVDLDIEDGEILWTMALHTETGGEISLITRNGLGISVEEELFAKDLPNIEFLAGEIPIVITNNVESTIEGSLGWEGEMKTSVELDSQGSCGFQYSSIDKSVKDISNSDYLSDGIEWSTASYIQGDAVVGVSFNLVSMLYDCTGASMGIGIEEGNTAKLCVDTDSTEKDLSYLGMIALSLYPKISGSIVVQEPVIDEEIASLELFGKDFEPLWEKKWESSDDWKDDFEQEMLNREWRDTYKLIIEDLKTQSTAEQIGIPAIYYSPTLEDVPDGRGGVATWFPNNNTEVVFFKKDISKEEPDGIPELFLGKREDGDTEIFAIFTYYRDSKRAEVVTSKDSYYDPMTTSKSVMLTKHDYIFEGTDAGGKQILLSGTTEIPFPIDFELDPSARDVLIDSNNLEWQSLDEW